MKALTIRNVPRRLGEALEREKRRRGASLNQTVLDLLSQCVGVGGSQVRRNGLARLAGTWTPEEYAHFEAAVAPTELLDDELWR